MELTFYKENGNPVNKRLRIDAKTWEKVEQKLSQGEFLIFV